MSPRWRTSSSGSRHLQMMACATPVIAFNRGSVPEVIDHGVTGYICEDAQGAVAALRRLNELSRTEIRTFI